MVVFFDIDGTIIDEPTQIIPESAVRAVQRLRENGHVPVVNTGRPYSHIDPRVRQMAFRGYVCGCGMEILMDGEKVVWAYPDAALRKKAVAVSRKYSMRSFYELEDGGLMIDGPMTYHKYMSPEVERQQKKGFPILQCNDCPELEFLKFVSFIQEGSDPEGFIRELSQDFTIIDRKEGMYELILKGFSKAAGVRSIMEHLHASQADTMAIGDSTNDLPMFAYAAHAVCLGSGMQEAKDASEYVTTAVLDDGIEKALQHYGLI